MPHRRSLTALAAAAWLAVVFAGAACAPSGTKKRMSPPRAPSGDAARRLVAMAAMDPSPSAYGSELQSLARHSDPLIRASAAHLLGAWAAQGDPRLAVPAVTHSDPLVRALAQNAYMAHNPQGMGVLLVDGLPIEVPRAILRALEQMREPQGLAVLPSLVNAHEDTFRPYIDASPEEAVLAAGVLSHASDLAARRWLLRLDGSGSEAVLAAAADPAARPGMTVATVVLPVIAEAGPVARRAAARALVLHPDPYFVPLLVEFAADEDVSVRRNAIRAMGNLGAAAPVDRLAEVLRQEPPEAKSDEPPPPPPGEMFDAVRALGEIGTEEAIDVLRQYVQEATPNEQLLIQVLLSVGPHADRSEIPWIAEHLRSEDAMVRAAAARALGDIGHPRSQAALIQTLDDPDALVRASTARAIGRIGSRYGGRHLVEMLDDPAPQVRAMAIQGLGVAGYRDAVPLLAAMARRPVPADQAPARLDELHNVPELASVMALGRIGSPEAVEALVGLLTSRSWITRATAVRALEAAGADSPETVEAVYVRLKDSANLVRAQALVTLKAFGEEFPPGYFQTH